MKLLTYEHIKQQFENKGWKLLSKEYENTNTKLKIECSEGHQVKVTYHSFQQGNRCPICFGNQQHTYKFVKQQFEEKGTKLLSTEYKNNKSKLPVECSKGRQYEITYNNFQQGRRCPICWELEKYSISEKDCLNVVDQILPNENVIENDRTQIINPKTNKYLELDIWIPSLNKAIEFNGEYWHESDYSKYKDNQKIKQCEEKSIDLKIINYKDWIENSNKINDLKSFLLEDKT